MAAPTVFASAATNPGGTGSSITVTLSTHAADDVLVIYVAKTGNASWTVPAGWTLLDQRSVGTSSNGITGTWFYRRVLSGDTLPLADPVCSLGATVTRGAICRTIRGADLEGIFTLPEWGARGFATGTANPVRPPTVTTLAPEMLVLHCYGQRTATNAPDPTNYTQDQEIIISGTLVLNASQRAVTDQNTSLANQDASPTSGARWAAGILCIPSPDYVYYRSGSQALTASGTSVTGTLPTGTSSSDWRTNKDLVIARVEAAGTPTISPQVGGDWTEITGQAGTTSGNGTTVRHYWAHYDGSLNLQFNRSTTGEIAVQLTTYRNTHQTTPIAASNIRQNASSTTSTWDALTRTQTKTTVIATCVADGTPSYTAPSGWTERMDGNGIVSSDQVYNAIGSSASASYTLSTASPTQVGLLEIASVSSTNPITVTPSTASLTLTAFAPTIRFNTQVTPTTANLTTTRFAPTLNLQITPATSTLTTTGFVPRVGLGVVPPATALSLASFAPQLNQGIIPLTLSVALTTFAPVVSTTDHKTITPATASLTLTAFAPKTVNTTPGYESSVVVKSSSGTGNPSAIITPEIGNLLVVYCFVSGNSNDTPTCSDDNGGSYDLVDVATLVAVSNHRLSVFVRTALMVNDNATTITVATGSNTSRIIHVYAIRGMNLAGSAAVRSSGFENNQSGTPAPTLDQSALAPSTVLIAFGSTDVTSQPPANWIKRHETFESDPDIALQSASRDFGFTGTTVTYDGAQIADYCSHALELDTSTTGVEVVPATATLITTSFAPRLQTVIIPSSASLTLISFAPSVTIKVTVPNASLALTTFAPVVTVALVFPQTPQLDDFNRADGALGASWTGKLFSDDNLLVIDTNRVKGSNGATNNNQAWATQVGPDCEVWTEIPAGTSDDNSTLLAARWSAVDTSTPDGYAVRARGGATNNVDIFRFDNGGVVGLGAIGQVVSDGDGLGLRIVGDKIYLYYKDVSGPNEWRLLLQATDSNYTAAGYIGLFLGGGVLRADNFGGGTLGAITVEPTAASLTLIGFAPTLKLVITPTTVVLTLTISAPSVTIQVTVPSTSLNLTTFAPTVDVSADVSVTPAAASLTLTSFAAQLQEVITPASQSLALTTFAPKLVQVITPTNATLSLTSFAPTVRTNTILTPASTVLTITTTAPRLHEVVTPSAATLSLTTFTPTVEIDVTVTPTTASLVLSAFASVLRERVTPAVTTLTITTFAPVIEVSADITVTPSAVSLALTGFVPALHERLTPTTASLSLVTFAPTITVSADKVVQPANASLTLQSFAPQLQLVVTPASATLSLSTSASSLQLAIQPTSTSLVLSTFAPTVEADITVTPAPANFTLTAFAPTVTTGGVTTIITPASVTLTVTSYAPWLFLGLVPANRTYVVESGVYEVMVGAGEYELLDDYEDSEVFVS